MTKTKAKANTVKANKSKQNFSFSNEDKGNAVNVTGDLLRSIECFSEDLCKTIDEFNEVVMSINEEAK